MPVIFPTQRLGVNCQPGEVDEMCRCSHGLIGRAEPENPRGPGSIYEKSRNFKVLEFKKVAQGDVVGMLKEMLAMARSGHLRAAAVAVHADTGDTGGAFALGNGDIAHLVCSLERIKQRLLEES
jgi:hypothetical protein